jgi:hypothetical protein
VRPIGPDSEVCLVRILDFPLWLRAHFFNFLLLSLLIRSGLDQALQELGRHRLAHEFHVAVHRLGQLRVHFVRDSHDIG